jgi:hypothetical protein
MGGRGTRNNRIELSAHARARMRRRRRHTGNPAAARRDPPRRSARLVVPPFSWFSARASGELSTTVSPSTGSASRWVHQLVPPASSHTLPVSPKASKAASMFATVGATREAGLLLGHSDRAAATTRRPPVPWLDRTSAAQPAIRPRIPPQLCSSRCALILWESGAQASLRHPAA